MQELISPLALFNLCLKMVDDWSKTVDVYIELERRMSLEVS